MIRSVAERLTHGITRATKEQEQENLLDTSTIDTEDNRSARPQHQPFIEFIESPMPPHSPPAAPLLIRRTSSSSSCSDSPSRRDERAIELTSQRKENRQTCIPAAPSHDSLEQSSTKQPLVSPTISLPLFVMIDMFSVSLVVPLLFQYYKTAGVTSASQRELLSSVFSSSQIVGGLLLGALADAGLVQRKTILFVSFAGSALSYALIVYGGLTALVVSRVLVGAVKQTMTICTTLLTHCTTRNDRAQHMGRLNASSTVAWIFGPSVGAFLYKNVDHRAPALLACSLFCVNIFLAAILLPRREEHLEREQPKKSLTSFTSNLKSCFSSKTLGSVITSHLIFTWTSRATSYASMASYYEEMYDMESHQRGYLSSYQQTLSFIVQSALVGPLLVALGGERKAIVFAVLLLAVATFCEIRQSLSFFLICLCPAISLSTALLNLSLRSLVTHVAPKESMGSVLAALDVLQNATAVSVPFYRTILFGLLGGSNEHAQMKGDPNPIKWVTSSGIHWLMAAVVMACLLLSPRRQEEDEEKEQPKMK
jgi:predicted MFS family arabinose efflux permease